LLPYARDARARDSLGTSNDCSRYKNVGELSLVPNRGASDTVSHFTNVSLWWGQGMKRAGGKHVTWFSKMYVLNTGVLNFIHKR